MTKPKSTPEVRAGKLPWILGALLASAVWSLEAAELRGRLVGAGTQQAPANVKIVVTCPESSPDVEWDKSGKYSARQLPADVACNLEVHIGKLASSPITFTTDRPVVRISGEVKVVGENVIILRKE